MVSLRAVRLSSIASLLVLFSRAVSAHNEDPRPDQYCVFACYNAADELTFNTTVDTLTEDYYTALCTNTLKIESIYYCAQAYCSEKQIHAGISLFYEICKWEASITVPAFSTVVTPGADIATIERVSEDAIAEATVFDTPVIPDNDLYTTAFKTTHAYYGNIGLAYDFLYAFYAFWAFVILMGVTSHLAQGWRRSHTNSSSSRLWLSIRRHLILPATFGSTCQEPLGWCTIPPRLESVTLMVYIVMNIVFCFPGYEIFAGNLFWPESREQLTRYFSDRCGVLAIANLPLIWLFATRNSPLLWMTGWSFATFNRFHRWVARMATALAVTHGIGYTVYSFYIDYYTLSWADQYFWCGVMALCCMTIILSTSVYWLRRYHYELFFNIHIVLAIVCTAALFYHVKIFAGKYDGFLWPCVAIWAFDRVLRFGRIVFNTVIPRIRHKTSAIATYHPDSDTIRLDVTDFLRGRPLSPGSFYYIYVPSAGIIRAYESHPFSLCSWYRTSAAVMSTSTPPSPIATLDPTQKKEIGATAKQVKSSEDLSQAMEVNLADDVTHTFLIRPQNGMTRRLRDHILASASSEETQGPHQRRVPLLLEGPYTSSLDPGRFSDLLIIVAGVGICEAVTLAHVAIVAGVKVKIIWALRERSMLNDVAANELGSLTTHSNFTLVACLTAGPQRDEEEAGKEEQDWEPRSDILRTTAWDLRFGRPDVEAEMRQARLSSSQHLAIMSCGPARLADQCRQAAVRVLGEEGRPMEYFNHTMGW